MRQDIWDDRIGYEDGEWVTWSDVDCRERDAARQALYANGDEGSREWFEALLNLAHDYHVETGGHLEVYGEIGELFGAAVFGIQLHTKRYAKGSDGKLGDDYVEIKTITPFKGSDKAAVRMDRHFGKVLVVRIDANFTISGRLIDKKLLPGTSRTRRVISWAALDSLPHTTCDPAGPEVWSGWD